MTIKIALEVIVLAVVCVGAAWVVCRFIDYAVKLDDNDDLHL